MRNYPMPQSHTNAVLAGFIPVALHHLSCASCKLVTGASPLHSMHVARFVQCYLFFKRQSMQLHGHYCCHCLKILRGTDIHFKLTYIIHGLGYDVCVQDACVQANRSLLPTHDHMLISGCPQYHLEQISNQFNLTSLLSFVLFHSVIGFIGPKQLTLPETGDRTFVAVGLVKGDFPPVFFYALSAIAVDGTASMFPFSR